MVITPDDHMEISSLDELFRRSKEFRSSKKFIEALNFVTRLRKYSVFNNFLVFVQNPNVTFYATASRWRKKFNRKVKEDARPMVILAPMTPVLFVYDVADTIGPPLPEYFEKAFEACGEITQNTYDMTLRNAKKDRIPVRRVKLSFLHGGSAIKRYNEVIHGFLGAPDYSIEINDTFSITQSYLTLCHELGHIYLGHLGSDPSRWWKDRRSLLSYNQAEIEAESVSFIIAKRKDIETRSAEYIAGYFKNDNDIERISLDLIFKIASHIEKMGEKELPERKEKPKKPSKSASLFDFVE